ncbi:MAG: transporter [Alphaproteobacteria bacterium]|nr:transporter [Alphaproteobacteria bacterium]
MHIISSRSAPALAALLAVAPAAAQAQVQSVEDNIVAVSQRADEHGPAGTMGEHVHKGGEFMVGLILLHEDHRGANQSGTRKLTNRQVAMAGYGVRTKSMTMDMAMLHLMWAPNDRVTLMAMPMWMRMEMTMLGVGAGEGHGEDMAMDGHAHHTLAPGKTMSHSVSGIGDTEVGALVSLSRKPLLSAHARLSVSIPTGSVSRKNASGKFVHYMMQGGSGTWDLIPSFTMSGGGETLRWGAQAHYRFRAEDRNKSGFRYGDRFDASAWLAKPLSPAAALTARLAYSDEGRIEGHYNGPHNHASPPDFQQNYGGQMIQAGLGANVVIGGNLRLGAEATVPLYQDLNGIQSPRRFGVNLNLSRMF